MNIIEKLKYGIASGKIDLSSVLEQMEKIEFEEHLAKHTNKVWQGIKGKWFTYIPTEDGRFLVRRNTKDDINEYLVSYYKAQNDEPTISSVFQEWIGIKLESKEIGKGTYDRYCNDFKRFFVGTSIEHVKVRTITTADLEDFIRQTIRKHNLTRKGFGNLRTLILGIFKMAKKNNHTDVSISWFFKDLELSNNIFTKTTKTKEEQIFMEDEIPIVVDYLRANPTIYHLGILLAFQTGLRSGELGALKKTDIVGRSIHVQRQEVRYKDPESNKSMYMIKDFPKTDKSDRYVIITDSTLETLEKIMQLNPDGEYLFESKGKRIGGYRYNKMLYKVCKTLKIPNRSMHKIRRTYGTTLLDKKVSEKVIMEQMGHSDISTTHDHYYYSNLTRKTKEDQIEKAMCI